jgi:hypothetical protein
MSNLAPLAQQQQTQATIAVPPQPLEAPSAWMRYGTSPAELILASSFLLIAQATIIWSIAGLVSTTQRRR